MPTDPTPASIADAAKIAGSLKLGYVLMAQDVADLHYTIARALDAARREGRLAGLREAREICGKSLNSSAKTAYEAILARIDAG